MYFGYQELFGKDSNLTWILGETFFFSGKNLLRVEYVIWIHDIHRVCPLKLDLSPRKKIIGVAFDPTKLEAMEVDFFSQFEAKVEKWGFARKSHGPPRWGLGY